MEKVLRDYRSRLQVNSRETERIKMYIRIIAFLRLSVVIVAALIVYLFRNEGVEVWGTTVLIGIVLFLSLARVHDRWFRKKEFVDCRDRIIHRELSLLEYRFDEIDGGSEFIDPSHDYSFDLDLFGERSFFAYINRTATAVGRVALSRELLHLFNFWYNMMFAELLGTSFGHCPSDGFAFIQDTFANPVFVVLYIAFISFLALRQEEGV